MSIELPPPSRIAAGTEYFYGFSVYLPSTWELSEEEDILFQWKGFGGGPFMFLAQKHEGLFLGWLHNHDAVFFRS